ncbi:hypothetical protein DL98DRAFT_661167 [Cadophora sp. DSE1049]|nr:hypothetical protein DL98DRAFT_661167 [Cadophora sp. DSE1049]
MGGLRRAIQSSAEQTPQSHTNVLSYGHGLESAVIEIKAKSNKNEELRFLKFAPHLAYGRISSESLKWTFQLGATLGVTKGPVNLSVNPSGGYEKDKAVGTMMKIQGSTRSTRQTDVHHISKRLPDRKLIWSLEENAQQETGLPREFTFVFLIERPSKTKEDLNAQLYLDYSATFPPINFSITAKPHISGIINGLWFISETENFQVERQVGQMFPTENTADSAGTFEDSDAGLYNSAKLPGSFEDLIELPGNAVSTVEPSLPEAGAGGK